jgi:hypothetical protein
MLVTAIRTEGLRADLNLTGLGRRVDAAAGEPGRRLADALGLWAGTLNPDALPGALVAVGAGSGAAAVEAVVEEGVCVGAGWDRPGAMAALLATGERRFGVEVRVELDPPLFARLREEAVRDPRLVSALGTSLALTVKVGWLLTTDGLGATVGVLALSLGGVDFPVSGSERAPWATRLLRDVGARVGRVDWTEQLDAVAARLHTAATSSDPERRARAARAAEALARPPFSFGRLEVLADGPALELAFGPELLRARRLGPAALHAVQLAEAVLLRQPDVLIVDGPGAGFSRAAAVSRWLERATAGGGATLEQVVLVPGGGA